MRTWDLPLPSRKIQQRARELRNNMTEAEWKLWGYIRRRQFGVRFRRQHPIGKFIVDFIALKIGLIIEVDGGQHYDETQSKKDKARTQYLESWDLKVIRFNNHEVLTNIEGVLECIGDIIDEMNH